MPPGRSSSAVFSRTPPNVKAPVVETIADDDPEDALEEGRDETEILSSINAIDIHRVQWTPSSDVRTEEPKGPPEPGSDPNLTDFDPDAIRAQINTGAFATCTDQLHMLHDYQEFNESHPSPIRLLPATENSDAVPQGYGYLHVPAHNSQGFLAVRTFYHPSLRTTVIDERDFVKAAGHKSTLR